MSQLVHSGWARGFEDGRVAERKRVLGLIEEMRNTSAHGFFSVGWNDALDALRAKIEAEAAPDEPR